VTVIYLCGALALAGLGMALGWGGIAMSNPPGGEAADAPPSAGMALRRLAWHLDVAVVSGLVAGIAAAGAGGRLAMRLLAATAGDAAQGRLTEAEQAVGRITTGGTLEFLVFTGLFSGILTGVGFAVLHRWLPRGRLAGLAFGGLLLVVGATRLEPLRAGNPDFDLVGPSWLGLVVFTVVVVVHGMVTAAVAGRLSRSLPLISRRPKALLAHLPLLVVLAPSPLLAGAVVAAATAVVVGRTQKVARLGSPRTRLAGRVVLGALVAVSLPGFVAALADIAGRGP